MSEQPLQDDPLAGMQSPFDPNPGDDEESRRRVHIAEQVAVALDDSEPRPVRENALRHMVACDPVRALGVLLTLAGNALNVLETAMGDKHGTAVREIRATNALLNAAAGTGEDRP
jgi:hypothetical protein